MTGAIRSEFRKLRTVRTTYYLCGGAAALALLAALGSDAGQPIADGMPLAEQQAWFVTPLLSRLIFVLVGIRIVTEEYRYGTITPSLLAVGSRTRLLTAKLVAASASAVAMALLAEVTLVMALTVLGDPPALADAAALIGMATAAALFAALGVALGTVIRQPVPATVGAVVWLLVGEDLLHVRLGEAVEYLPGYAGLTLSGAADVTSLAPALAGAVLLGWVVAAVIPAAVLLHRRDVG